MLLTSQSRPADPKHHTGLFLLNRALEDEGSTNSELKVTYRLLPIDDLQATT